MGINKDNNTSTPPRCNGNQFRDSPLTCNVGIINKGNTCYINSVLQCLSVVPEFWANNSHSSRNQSNFFPSFLKIMALLKTSKAPLDPSQFLRYLKQIVIKSRRNENEFNIFEQQDACEILSCILNGFCSDSVPALNLIKI